ncbi:MAG TPA: hypothetical protein VF960_10855 [Chloroflexota bacterium]
MTTVPLSTLKGLFWEYQNQRWQGTATGGSTTTLVDTTVIDLKTATYPFPTEDWQIRITSGASAGDLRQIVRADHATGTLYANRAFSSTGPTTGDTYEIWGNSIHGGPPLTRLFCDVLGVAMPVTEQQITIVTNQAIYDVSTIVRSPDLILEVWLHVLDPAGLWPYRPVQVPWWNARLVPDTGTGAMLVKLEIAPILVNNPAIQELWMTYQKDLPDFTDDTSTVDAVYKEWLAWEAVLLHANRMATQNADKGRWQELQRQAVQQVKAWRELFMPNLPRRQKFSRVQVM